MNKRVITAMMNMPFTVFAKALPDSMGDRAETRPATYYGYIQETIQNVINSEGKEELSNLQIYIAGDDGVGISPDSEITCLTHVKQRIIKRAIFYNKNGSPDVAVLYLP